VRKGAQAGDQLVQDLPRRWCQASSGNGSVMPRANERSGWPAPEEEDEDGTPRLVGRSRTSLGGTSIALPRRARRAAIRMKTVRWRRSLVVCLAIALSNEGSGGHVPVTFG
jgi:hypothetical protein